MSVYFVYYSLCIGIYLFQDGLILFIHIISPLALSTAYSSHRTSRFLTPARCAGKIRADWIVEDDFAAGGYMPRCSGVFETVAGLYVGGGGGGGGAELLTLLRSNLTSTMQMH